VAGGQQRVRTQTAAERKVLTMRMSNCFNEPSIEHAIMASSVHTCGA
jgi:hypothetical protein